MKIFLDENFIQLAEKAPADPPDNMEVRACWSTAELEVILDRFERDGGRFNLYLYPADEQYKLEEGFASLFKYINAAGGIVTNEMGEMLFIYRWGKWDLPKGKLHKKRSESPEEGAVREVMEETGLTRISITKELIPTFHIYSQEGKRILKKTWWYLMSGSRSEQLKPQADEDITEAKWVDPKDMGEVLENTYASLRELLFTVTRNT